MESGRVRRTTLFKVPEPEKQAKLVEAFRVLADTQEKACHCSSPPGPVLRRPFSLQDKKKKKNFILGNFLMGPRQRI